MMARLKQIYDTALAHTQQQPLTNIYATDVCECLKTRNMCKTKIEPVSEVNCRPSRARKLLYLQKTCNSIYSKGSFKASLPATTYTHPAFYSYIVPTISLALYRNLLQQLVGWLVWQVTASTAISIFAVFYYFIANTQGASAIFNVTAANSSASTSLSLAVLHTSLRTPSPTNSSIFQKPHIYSSNSYSNNNASSITLNHHNSSTNKIYFNLFSDLNYDTNSTEIAIASAVSSLAATEDSSFSFDINYNNSIYDYYNNVITVSYNDSLSSNETFDRNTSEYIFDRTDVRVIFITLYTLVFCCCFFGNLLVMLVVTLSRRLRSITNFFLANLALADFCVGLFCVMQNLSIYLIDSWVFGEFLCRMYQFVHSLSYAASIFILVVICVERYCAIVHPITCKQIITASRLRIVISTVWIISALYSTPKFLFSTTIKNVHTASGREEVICVLDRKMFNSQILDMINFVFLYAIPLLIMTILYSKIAIALWRSSRGLQHHLAQQENSMGMHNSMYHNHGQNNNHNSQPQENHHHHHLHHNNHHHHLHHHHLHNHHQQLSQLEQNQQPATTSAPVGNSIAVTSSAVSGTSLSCKHSCKYDGRHGVDISESQVSLDDDRPVVSTCRKTSFYKHSHNHLSHQQQTQPPATTNQHRTHAQQQSLNGSQRVSHISHSSNNVLRARRGVVRMLIIFVLTFALCNLPYHARKMWQYWSRSYRGDSNFNALLTPLTFLVTYFNSGVNPLLYAFLSRNFRKGMKELLMCSWRKSKTKSSTNSSRHHKRMTMQTNSLPTDITHIGNEQL